VGVEKFVSSVTWTESCGRRDAGIGEKRVSSKALCSALAMSRFQDRVKNFAPSKSIALQSALELLRSESTDTAAQALLPTTS
jgi:hypothetical protein